MPSESPHFSWQASGEPTSYNSASLSSKERLRIDRLDEAAEHQTDTEDARNEL